MKVIKKLTSYQEINEIDRILNKYYPGIVDLVISDPNLGEEISDKILSIINNNYNQSLITFESLHGYIFNQSKYRITRTGRVVLK